MRSSARLLGWVWAVLVVVGVVAVAVAATSVGEINAAILILLWLPVLYVSLGLVIVIRRPGNSVAWLLYVVGTWLVLEGAADLRIDGKPDPATTWDILAIVWQNSGYFVGLLLPLLLLFYIFPTGRFLTKRWSWAGWLAGVMAPIVLIAEGFGKEVGPDAVDWTVDNPVGFLDSGGLENTDSVHSLIFGLGLMALAVGAIPALVIRYRRADVAVRSQIKWVVYAFILVLIAFATSAVSSGLVSEILFFLSILMVPVSIAIAVTRYNLYEIDRLISRTVSYVIVVAMLGLVYAAGAIWLPTKVAGEQSPIFVAGSTLAIAALFNPLRKRMQHTVDRRFNRSGYEAETISEQFATGLQDTLTVDQISELWTETVKSAVHPSAAGIWLKSD